MQSVGPLELESAILLETKMGKRNFIQCILNQKKIRRTGGCKLEKAGMFVKRPRANKNKPEVNIWLKLQVTGISSHE